MLEKTTALAITMLVIPAITAVAFPSRWRFVVSYALLVACAVTIDAVVASSGAPPISHGGDLESDSSVTPVVTIPAAIGGLLWIALWCQNRHPVAR